MNPVAKKEKQDELITAENIAAGIIGIGIGAIAYLAATHIVKHRRNPLWDEIRKQPVITEDAEFEVLADLPAVAIAKADDNKEIKLIEDKRIK